jgi:hypothetical protein
VALLFARQAVTAVAKQRLELKERLSWESLEGEREVLKASIRFQRSQVVAPECKRRPWEDYRGEILAVG